PIPRPAGDAPMHSFPDWLPDVLALAGVDSRTLVTRAVAWDGGHSNDIAEIRLVDGRVLLLKRGRHEWTRQAFAASAAAARVVTAASDIVVPEPVDLDTDAAGAPLQA